VDKKGVFKEVLNSDAKEYGGSGIGNMGEVRSTPVPYHGHEQSISLILPPLAIVFFRSEAV
jgi:1,4-alpha-glucan branching enzyme